MLERIRFLFRVSASVVTDGDDDDDDILRKRMYRYGECETLTVECGELINRGSELIRSNSCDSDRHLRGVKTSSVNEIIFFKKWRGFVV